jgi:uncharacterized protein YjbI with pentapeptide repeats
LSDANFSGAILDNANFTGCNLSGAMFSNASAKGANFTNALSTLLTGPANFSDANLMVPTYRRFHEWGGTEMHLKWNHLSGAILSNALPGLYLADQPGCKKQAQL